MPSPIELLLDPVSLIILLLYIALMLWEAIFPARKLPYVKHWKIKGLTSFILFFYVSSYLPLLVEPYLASFRLFDLTELGTVGGALLGTLVYELGLYVWHRSLHWSDLLWRFFHQMHHSAERLDTYGAFFLSPLDMIGFTMLGSISFTVLVGVSPQAITAILLLTNFLSIFQHANIKSPRWLGYLIQRPESHTIHHGRGLHKYNYCDLPLFDIIFGTFYNPEGYECKTGFYDGATDRIFDMLMFKDVSESEDGPVAAESGASLDVR